MGIPQCGARRKQSYCSRSFLNASTHPYIRYLCDDVKPFIDQRFRSGEHAAVMGTSFGGLLAFTVVMTHPYIFRGGLCLSPSFWFHDAEGHSVVHLFQDMEKFQSAEWEEVRIYVDGGTGADDASQLYEARHVSQALVANGLHEGVQVFFYEAKDASHNEESWKQRMHIPLSFLYGGQ